MRKYVFMCLLSISSLGFAQEEIGQTTTDSDKTVFRTRSISFMAPLGFYSDGSTGGGAFDIDFTFEYGKNLFTLMGGIGNELQILEASDSFQQVNLFYGREFKAARTVFLETHAGAGYFSWKSVDVDPMRTGEERATTIGLPIMTKIRIHTGPRFSIGWKMGVTINSANTITYFGMALQWNNRKW